MFDGGVSEQLHQFIAAAASRTTPASSPSPSLSLPPFPLHHHGGGFDPFVAHGHHNNSPHPPAPTHHLFPPPPTQPQHHLFHQLHHKEDDRRREDNGHERRVADESISHQSGDRPWRNDEVIALLRVRSSMEAWFPSEITWEQVSRKLAEIGYRRSPEKCKEKFEEQSIRSIFSHNNNVAATATATTTNLNFSKNNNNYRLLVGDELEVGLYAPPQMTNPNPPQFELDRHDKNIVDKTMEELPREEDEQDSINVRMNEESRTEETANIAVKKRRVGNNHRFEMFKGFCLSMVEKLMIQQEEMHRKLLEDMLQRDKEMVEREEAWKKVEMEKMKKELDLRAKEQSIIGTRQAAIIDFLKKLTDKTEEKKTPSTATEKQTVAKESIVVKEKNNAAESDTRKRWPREEVLALINLRCSINGGSSSTSTEDPHGGPTKAPLWERISQAMSERGYHRSSKRCKEKWENINKYFRKTKDISANKKRSVESRTCPYFHQLSVLYNQGKLVLSSENRPNSPENDQAAASGSKLGDGE